uniref:glycoside hydrolase family 10 protein n=1 Tax=Peterkaempfera griseoplana TaxID=66896 RepID=UPI000AC690F9
PGPGRPRPSRRTLLRAAGIAAGTAAAGLSAVPARAVAPPAAAAAAGQQTAGTAASPQASSPGDRGLRGEWIATVANIDWPSRTGLSPAEQQAEFTGLLDRAMALRLNAVFVQVRPAADAFWPSRFEPWSQYLTGTQGQDPGYDPLAFMVEAAHSRGLALHAWFNPYRVSLQSDPAKLAPTHPARLHPEWIVGYAGQLYYNPGVPAARAFVEDAILDAVERYEIDGVHFDDYFYPYPSGTAAFPDDEAFAAYGGGFTDRAAWRRNNVDLLVREVRDRVRAARPEAAFGISPFGIWRNASSDPEGSATNGTQSYDALNADTLGWVRKGWLDYIAPQLYWNIGLTVADYAVLAPWWARAVRDTDVQLWIGQAVYKAGDPSQPAAWQDPAELSRHLAMDESMPEISGEILYSSADVIADRVCGVSTMAADHWRRPALPPVLPRLADGPGPLPPRGSAVRTADGGVRLEMRSRGERVPALYAVRQHSGPQGAGELLAVVPGARVAWWDGPAAPHGAEYRVSAVDRANRESCAVTVHPRGR